jgi:hypothetical protein
MFLFQHVFIVQESETAFTYPKMFNVLQGHKNLPWSPMSFEVDVYLERINWTGHVYLFKRLLKQYLVGIIWMFLFLLAKFLPL